MATVGGRYECHICRVRYTTGASLTKHLMVLREVGTTCIAQYW